MSLSFFPRSSRHLPRSKVREGNGRLVPVCSQRRTKVALPATRCQSILGSISSKFSNACKAEQIANYIGGTLHIGNAAAGEMLKPDVVGKEAYSLKDGPFSRARPLSRCDIMQQALRNFPATRQSLYCKCSVDCIGLKFLRHCCSSFKFHHKSSPTQCQNWGPALT